MAAINLDDDLTIQESPWRGRIITFGVLLAIAAAIGAGLYFFYFKSDSETLTRSTEDITVKKSTINQTLIISRRRRRPVQQQPHFPGLRQGRRGQREDRRGGHAGPGARVT